MLPRGFGPPRRAEAPRKHLPPSNRGRFDAIDGDGMKCPGQPVDKEHNGRPASEQASGIGRDRVSNVIDVMGNVHPAVDLMVSDETPSPRRFVEPLGVAHPATQPKAEAKALLDLLVTKAPSVSPSDVDQSFQSGDASGAHERKNERCLDSLGEEQGTFRRTQSVLGRRRPGPRSARQKHGATHSDSRFDSNAQAMTLAGTLRVSDHRRTISRFTHGHPHDICVEQHAKCPRCLNQHGWRSEGGARRTRRGLRGPGARRATSAVQEIHPHSDVPPSGPSRAIHVEGASPESAARSLLGQVDSQ